MDAVRRNEPRFGVLKGLCLKGGIETERRSVLVFVPVLVVLVGLCFPRSIDAVRFHRWHTTSGG